MWEVVTNAIEKFFEKLESCKSQDKIIVWLSGGTSLELFYDILESVLSFTESSLVNKLIFIYLDERNVSFDSGESNYKLTQDLFLWNLVKMWRLKSEQIKILTSDNYKNYLDNYNKIDIALFWVGEDWHIASLFPSLSNEWDYTNNYTKISNSPKLPCERFTITPKGLEKIDLSFLFFIWEKKRWVYKKYQLWLLEESPISFLKNIDIITNITEKIKRSS